MRRLVAGAGLTAALLLALAPDAHAANVSGGCAGSASSFDGDGGPLSEISAPGRGGSSKDPFIVDPDGTVTYEGSTPVALHDHSWSIEVMGITVKSGGSANAEDETTSAGEVVVDDYLPVPVAGLFKVDGSISADEGTCAGGVWVKVAGSPVGSLPWLVGVAATVGGAAAIAGPAIASGRGLLRRGT